METNTSTQAYERDVESRVGQARLEEGLKHLGEKMAEGFERLEQTMTNRGVRYDALESRVGVVEKRVDKHSFIVAAIVFIGSPVMCLLTFGAKHWFGW